MRRPSSSTARHVPEFAGDVVLADQADVHARGCRAAGRFPARIGFARADHVLDHRLAGDAIAKVLGTIETGAVDRHDRHTPAFRGALQTAAMSSPSSAVTQVA